MPVLFCYGANSCLLRCEFPNMAAARASTLSNVIPTFDEEARLWSAGYDRVAGLDEAGRGALAGPVVAGAVIAPTASSLTGVWAEVRDSKLLRPARREALGLSIERESLAWGVGVVEAVVIDEIGVASATKQAMMQALWALGVKPDFLLIDWVKLPQSGLPQLCTPKADQRMASVAAASILAKVTRDRLMDGIGIQYPSYAFGEHKGYGTAQHLAALNECGPCPQHRFSFAPVAHSSTLLDTEKSQL